jgi:hypothetical protein
MTGVVPTLIAGYNVEPLCQQIDDFPFALVAPLRAQDDYVVHSFRKLRLLQRTIVAMKC